MVNFVEQATLIAKDKASPTLRKVNKELMAMAKNAAKVNKLKLAVKGLTQTSKQLDGVSRKLAAISRRKNQTVNIKYRQTTSGAAPSGVPATPAAPRGPMPPGIPANGRFGIDTGPLRRTLNDSWRRMAYSIETAIINGFSRATTERDVSAASLDLLNLSPEKRAKADQIVTSINTDNTQFNEGQIRGVLAEVLRTTRFDSDAAAILTRQAVELARLQVLQGENASTAINSAFEFVKAAEQSGNVTDAAGAFDEDIAQAFFDNIKKNIIGGGREITAALVRTLVKSLRVARFGLNDRGFTTALALAEEQGSTAGVGLNQAVKQLSGQGQTSYRVTRLADLGLLTTEEVQTGTVNGKPVTETRTNVPLNNELLREDPATWVRKYLIPALEKEGIDTNNAAIVSKAVNDIVGNRTAVETVTALILRSDELKAQGDLVSDLRVDQPFLKGVEDNSTVTALANAQAGLEDSLGAVGESLESILIPALNKVGSFADGLASFIEGPTGEGSAGRTAAVVGGGALTAAALLAGLKQISPFKLAGASLTTAGSMLQAAATALQRSAAARAVGGGGMGRAVAPVGVGGAPKLGINKITAGLGVLNVVSLVAGSMDVDVLSKEHNEKLKENDRNLNLGAEKVLDNVLGKTITDLLVTRQSEMDNPATAMLEEARKEATVLRADLAEFNALLANLNSGDVKVDDDSPILQQRDAILAELAIAEGKIPTLMEQAFVEGGKTMQSVASEVDKAAERMGPRIGNDMLTLAPEIGRVIGETAKQVISDATVALEVPEQTPVPRLNTGTSTPF